MEVIFSEERKYERDLKKNYESDFSDENKL